MAGIVSNGSTYNASRFLDDAEGWNDTEDYDYDYDASISNIPIEEMVAVSLVYGLTLVLGVTGNILVILTIVRIQRMRNVTNTFLMSLATSDLMILMFCLPIKFAKWFSFTWDFGEFLCKGVHYLQNVSLISSVLTLTAMSLERHYAILHPIKSKYICTKKHARVVLAIVWVMAFILASPILKGQVHRMVGTVRIGYWCVKQWPTTQMDKAYELGMLCLVFVVPIAVMTYAYVGICKELWLVTSRRESMMAASRTVSSKNGHGNGDQKNDDNNTRKQVIKMLVAVIVLYSICHGPCLIDNVLASFGIVHKLNYGILKHIRMAFFVMSYFNSCVNPLVYAFMSKTFRDGFKSALCLCLKRGETFNHPAYSSAPMGYNYDAVTMAASSRPSPYPSPGSRRNEPFSEAKSLNSNCLLITDANRATRFQ